MRHESCRASQGTLEPNDYQSVFCAAVFVLTIKLPKAHNLNFYLATLFSPTLFSALFSFNVCVVCVCLRVYLGGECAFYTRPQFIKADKPIMFL